MPYSVKASAGTWWSLRSIYRIDSSFLRESHCSSCSSCSSPCQLLCLHLSDHQWSLGSIISIFLVSSWTPQSQITCWGHRNGEKGSQGFTSKPGLFLQTVLPCLWASVSSSKINNSCPTCLTELCKECGQFLMWKPFASYIKNYANIKLSPQIIVGIASSVIPTLLCIISLFLSSNFPFACRGAKTTLILKHKSLPL